MEQEDQPGGEDMIPLALLIVVVEGAVATPTQAPLDVVFKNISRGTVRLLKHFDEQDLPIWFEVELRKPDGTPLLGAKGGGKIRLRGPLEYVELKPGERFTLRLNVAAFFESPLPEGEYHASITYRNQYGRDCFQGELSSNTVAVTIPVREKSERRR